METTWDGLPIAVEHPRGSTVVVRRADGPVLLLHRAHQGPDFAGDWAWTAPAGARQPGEPVAPAALRELAEEAGIVGTPIVPVDVGGGWALFTARVPVDTGVVLHDVEHDAYEWLPVEAAAARITPTPIADGLRRAAATDVHDIAFRPLAEDDLPRLYGWLRAPHVTRWWHDVPEGPADVAAKYRPRIDGRVPIHVDVLEVAGEPVGFAQSYPLDGDPVYHAAAGGGPDMVAVDYLIGVAALVGVGLGTQALWAYARDVIRSRWPGTRHVVADPAAANTASRRACEKAGFRHTGDLPNGDTIHVLDVAHMFGPDPTVGP